MRCPTCGGSVRREVFRASALERYFCWNPCCEQRGSLSRAALERYAEWETAITASFDCAVRSEKRALEPRADWV